MPGGEWVFHKYLVHEWVSGFQKAHNNHYVSVTVSRKKKKDTSLSSEHMICKNKVYWLLTVCPEFCANKNEDVVTVMSRSLFLIHRFNLLEGCGVSLRQKREDCGGGKGEYGKDWGEIPGVGLIGFGEWPGVQGKKQGHLFMAGACGDNIICLRKGRWGRQKWPLETPGGTWRTK